MMEHSSSASHRDTKSTAAQDDNAGVTNDDVLPAENNTTSSTMAGEASLRMILKSYEAANKQPQQPMVASLVDNRVPAAGPGSSFVPFTGGNGSSTTTVNTTRTMMNYINPLPPIEGSSSSTNTNQNDINFTTVEKDEIDDDVESQQRKISSSSSESFPPPTIGLAASTAAAATTVIIPIPHTRSSTSVPFDFRGPEILPASSIHSNNNGIPPPANGLTTGTTGATAAAATTAVIPIPHSRSGASVPFDFRGPEILPASSIHSHNSATADFDDNDDNGHEDANYYADVEENNDSITNRSPLPEEDFVDEYHQVGKRSKEANHTVKHHNKIDQDDCSSILADLTVDTTADISSSMLPGMSRVPQEEEEEQRQPEHKKTMYDMMLNRARKTRSWSFYGMLAVCCLLILILITLIILLAMNREIILNSASANNNTTTAITSSSNLDMTVAPQEENFVVAETLSPEPLVDFDQQQEQQQQQNSSTTIESNEDTTTTSSCVDTVEVSLECYGRNSGEVLLYFQSCRPQPGDWVGIHEIPSPQDESVEGFDASSIVTWSYTCGTQRCYTTGEPGQPPQPPPPQNGVLPFPNFTEQVATGTYRADLMRISGTGPMYSPVASSPTFRIVENPNTDC